MIHHFTSSCQYYSGGKENEEKRKIKKKNMKSENSLQVPAVLTRRKHIIAQTFSPTFY
jgi:hypothetical protein